jgi:RNA polymerase sigma-70 factor (ECF subfamily)
MNLKGISRRDAVAVIPEPASWNEMHDDDQLVKQAKADPARFAELYDRHLTAVYRYVLARVGNVADAEDVTSQTFLQALEHLDRYRGTGQFRAWLFRIARNRSVDFFRQRRQHVELDDDADAVDETLVPAEELVAEAWQADQILMKLGTLSTDRAEAIRLCFVAGLEVSEIAVAMNRQESAVRMLIHRGIHDLKARMNPGPLESLG